MTVPPKGERILKMLIICAAVLAALLLALLWIFRTAFYSPPGNRDKALILPDGEQYAPYLEQTSSMIKDMEELPWEEVCITSFDGTELFGRYFHTADGAPLQIQFHGYRGSAFRDFCGGNRLARKLGQNTLLVDQRAHGRSGGRVITFGIKERYDCLCWANYARERFGAETPVILAGVSMGGATVLMASELKLPDNVVGIIADCPYSSPADIIRKVCGDMGLPPKLAFPFVRLCARLFGRFDLTFASAVEAVRNTKLPILIFHGEDDRFVPCEMSGEIAGAGGSKVIRATFPGAGHGLCYMLDTERYEALTREFVGKCLGKAPAAE